MNALDRKNEDAEQARRKLAPRPVQATHPMYGYGERRLQLRTERTVGNGNSTSRVTTPSLPKFEPPPPVKRAKRIGFKSTGDNDLDKLITDMVNGVKPEAGGQV